MKEERRGRGEKQEVRSKECGVGSVACGALEGVWRARRITWDFRPQIQRRQCVKKGVLLWERRDNDQNVGINLKSKENLQKPKNIYRSGVQEGQDKSVRHVRKGLQK